jgi:hydroxypyruvate reductase
LRAQDHHEHQSTCLLRGAGAKAGAALPAVRAAIERARAEALRVFLAGVAAADPARAVRANLQAQPLPLPGAGGRYAIIAVGKAAPAMARAARALLGEAVETLVVTQQGNSATVPGADLRHAGHPVPDAAGQSAAAEVLRRAGTMRAGDVLLVLVSGGASALLPAPVAGISLDDKVAVNRALLASGADIAQMNLVRQALSRIKGGGLAAAAAPAQVVALILSDVIGDDLRCVASGPTTAPLGTPPEAAALLHKLGIWNDLPGAVRAYLGTNPPPCAAPEGVDNRLIGSNARSLAAMAAAAGAGARSFPKPLVGDVAQAAETVLAAMPEPGNTVLFGGETTVRVAGGGRGGRNQELALRLALLAEARNMPDDWVFLSAGTDGRDGPTDAAGAVVDAGTLARMRAAGTDPEAALAANDSYPALASSEDLIRTGATGTNVADLQVLMRLGGKTA